MPLRHLNKILAAAALAVFAAEAAQAQVLAATLQPAPASGSSATSLEAPRSMRAVRVDQPIRLDGRFDEAAWAAADVASDFVQRQPQVGQPSSERTEVRVLYDEGAVYVAARMFDTQPRAMQAPLARASRISKRPAMTSGSLLAIKVCLPARTDASVGSKPAAPTMADITRSASGAAAT